MLQNSVVFLVIAVCLLAEYCNSCGPHCVSSTNSGCLQTDRLRCNRLQYTTQGHVAILCNVYTVTACNTLQYTALKGNSKLCNTMNLSPLSQWASLIPLFTNKPVASPLHLSTATQNFNSYSRRGQHGVVGNIQLLKGCHVSGVRYHMYVTKR